MKTYIIEYSLLLTNSDIKEFKTKDGWSTKSKMRVKNCLSTAHAQVKLDDYLRSRNPDFERLIVHSVNEDNIFSSFFPWL